MPRPREQVTIRLPAELMDSVRHRAVRDDRTKTQVIEECVRQEFAPDVKQDGGSGLPDYGDLPTREEFDAVAEIVKDLKRLAENAM